MVSLKIDIQKKDLWFLSAIIVFLIGVGFVVAYNSGGPARVMGHSFDEIELPNCADNQILQKTALGWECKDLSLTSGSPPLKFEVYNPDTTTYACVQKDLQEWCGDEDGCTIRLLMQHEIDGNDQVHIIDEHIYMEQTDLSNNHNSGIYGWTRQSGGGDHSWIMGTSGRYSMFSPWDWMWVHNYIHDWCSGQVGNGPAFSNPYEFNFMSHPHVRTNVIVYDSIGI